MITISLCMIVKNEQDVIGRCLDRVADLVDEVIIVDTGSTDRTCEIVRGYTDQLYSFDWIDDFAAARNFSFSKASCDYCMWLDADDILQDIDRQRFRALKESLDPSVDIVMLPYQTGFDAQGNVTFSYYRERIIKNHAGHSWIGAVHEVIPLTGTVQYGDAAVTHGKSKPGDSDRNLRIYEHQLAQGVELDPRQQFYYARELYYHQRYEDAIRVLEAYLDSGKGWIENVIDACCQTAYCYYALGKDDQALRSLLRSLAYDQPRAEVCCDLGRHFLDRTQYPIAAFWYELALTRVRNDQSGGFVSPDCYGYLPSIQLCVCYDRMGDRQRAQQFNEQAGRFKPDSPQYQYNRAYFAQLAGNQVDLIPSDAN